jgi:hypothetical protein
MSLQTLGHRAGIFSAAFLAAALTLGAGSSAQSDPPAGASPTLAEDAPVRYTVRTGDTLWDIASLFLRDPWLWPEIWYVNPQVDNPHLIYPGDVLVLAYGPDGRPQITLERGGATRLSPRVRSQSLEGAITTIPYEAVAAFMSRPMVLDKEQIESAPHVVSSRDQHLVTATGNTIYVQGLDGESGGPRYSIVQVGEPLRDPDDRDIVGYQGIYAAEARLTRAGEPATLEITASQRETHNGDLLFPTDFEMNLDFMPRAPAETVDGRIMLLVNAISMVGQYQAVVINRGAQHGLEPGHVLTVYQAGPVVRDRGRAGPGSNRVGQTFAPKVQLPDERSGTLMVFKAFDRISYALILESEAPIRELDRVGNP